MANNFTLTLDTLAPSNPSVSIDGGAQYCTAVDRLSTLTIGTGDGTTTGYQMKIWGDVDTAYNANIKDTEGNSVWITYATSQQIKLSTGDGTKTIYLKIRDDVYNESAQTSDSIVLDTSIPTVTISGPDVSKVSKQTGKRTCAFSFQSDSDFVEYKVKVVASSGAANDTGTLIATTNGSTNMAGTGTWTNSSVINCQIDGADLEVANAGDGDKIIKVFVKDSSNQWSA